MLMTPLPVHGSLSELRLWWDKLLQFGPILGYFPNPSKICLIVKESFYHERGYAKLAHLVP